MSTRLDGFCAGVLAGYAATRFADALHDLRSAPARLSADPARYASKRRAFALAAMARSLASLELAPAAARLLGGIRTPKAALDTAIVCGLLALASGIVELPVAYVEEFVTERNNGTSDQKRGAWLDEYLRGRALEVPITAIMFVLAFVAMRRFPRRWPLVTALAIPPLLAFASIVVPVAIAPLFNRFEPLEGPIAARLRRLAWRFGVGDATLLRVDASRQTNKANAYVTGLLGTHRIVVADTLLDHFKEDEIEFVVAHELGHYVAHDTWRGIGLGTAAGAAIVAVAARGRPQIERPDDLLRIASRAGMLSLAAGPLLAAFSRSIERRADTFAIAATGDPQSGVRAFTRLRERNLAEDEAPWWWESFFATHPSLRRRIDRLKAATPG